VGWEQISHARVIVEAGLEHFRVTPSQGTHFFQNITSLRIGYFTVNPCSGDGRVDWEWLKQQTEVRRDRHVRHVRTASPLRVLVDGQTGEGAILPPDPEDA
jgi:hypothetical protein